MALHIPEQTALSVGEQTKNDEEVKNLHPADELELLNARIARSTPEDDALPSMLDRRRSLSKRLHIERLVKQLKAVDDDTDDGFIGPQVGGALRG